MAHRRLTEESNTPDPTPSDSESSDTENLTSSLKRLRVEEKALRRKHRSWRNRVSKMAISTFSGERERQEDVDNYIIPCSFYWMGSGLPEKEMSEAKANQLYAGLTGSAMNSMQKHSVANNFDQAAAALRSKFPWIPYREEPEKTIKRIFEFRQYTSQGLEKYIDEAIRLRARLFSFVQTLGNGSRRSDHVQNYSGEDQLVESQGYPEP